MKTTLTLFALLICFTLSAQRSQVAPKTVYDTTSNTQRFSVDWGGELRMEAQDSSTFDTATGNVKWNRDYISLNNSYFILSGVTKKRVVATGDTIQRQEVVRVQFVRVPVLVGLIYNNTVFKATIKREMRKLLLRKISEE